MPNKSLLQQRVAIIILVVSWLQSTTCQYIDESNCANMYWNYANQSTPTCNPSKYRNDWRSQTYTGFLATDPKFWRYQAQTAFKLTNGLALDFAAEKCKTLLTNLITFKSGRHGPGESDSFYNSAEIASYKLTGIIYRTLLLISN